MAFFNFFLKKWEHSRAKIYNTLQPIRPSIHPLRRLIIDWQSEVEMASASLQPIRDTPVKALANRSLSRQPKLSLPWRGRLHTPCSFTWVPSKLKQWDNLWKSRGGSQVNLCPRAVPRVINLPLGVDWRPEGFSESKPKATSSARPKAKIPRGCLTALY